MTAATRPSQSTTGAPEAPRSITSRFVALVHFQERWARKPLAGTELNEPPSDEMREAFRIDKCHDLVFRHQRLPANLKGACGENGTLEFDDGKFFRLVPGQALDACRDEAGCRARQQSPAASSPGSRASSLRRSVRR